MFRDIRAFVGFGAMALLLAAFLLLPMRAAMPVGVLAQEQVRPQPGLDRERLLQAQREIEELRRQLQAREKEAPKERRETDEKREEKKPPQAEGRRPPFAPPFRPPFGKGPPSGDVERRLNELERKIDNVLHELVAMRRELRPGGAPPGNRPPPPPLPPPPPK